MAEWGDVGAEELLETPPDGVQLSALGSDGEALPTPEECEQAYMQAFEDAGGEEALRSFKNLSTKLLHLLADEPKPVTQMMGWQSHGLKFMMDKLGDGTDIRAYGIKCIEGLVARVQEHSRMPVELQMGGVKKWERASVKTRIKYGLDCSRLVDYNRATLVCENIKDMYGVVQQLFLEWGPQAKRASMMVKEFEDHYQRPMGGGYRHIQLLVLIGGSMWELQVNTRPMVNAKHVAGHKMYKTTRFVREMLLFTALSGSYDALDKLLSCPGVHAVADATAVKDKNGLSALHHAALRGDTEIMRLLWDTTKVSVPADPWQMDKTILGGLPLNYAMQVRNWQVVKMLAAKMAETAADTELTRSQHERLSEACNVAIDSYYEQEVPEVLEALMHVWQVVGVTYHWQGMSPLSYALHSHAEGALEMFIRKGYFNLWEVDGDRRLPLEAAISRSLYATARLMVGHMPATRPLMLTPEAARSLSRCRRADIEGLQDMISEIDVKLQGRIVSAGWCNGDECLRVHGAQDLELVGHVSADHTSRARCSCLALDGDTLYVGTSNGHIFQYNAGSDMKKVYTFRNGRNSSAHHQYVADLLLGSKRPRPDGAMKVKRLFSASTDNTVCIWDLDKRWCLATLSHGNDVTALARLDSTLFCATAGRSSASIQRYNIAKVGGTKGSMKVGELRGHAGDIESMAVVGERLFSAGVGAEILVWDRDSFATGRAASKWEGHTEGYRVVSLAVGASDTLFSAANPDRLRYDRKSVSSREYRSRPGDGPGEIRHWSPFGECLVSNSADQELTFTIRAMTWHHGTLMVADCDAVVHLWDSDSGALIAEAQLHDQGLHCFNVGELDAPPADYSDEESASSRAASRSPPSGDGLRATGKRRSDAERAATALKATFKSLDPSHDGKLTVNELKKILQGGVNPMADNFVEALFAKMDANDDGHVVFDEFVDFVFRSN